MGASQILAVFGGLVTLAVALGAAIALIKGSYNRARIEALRGDLADARNKINDLRTTVTDLEHEAEKDRLTKVQLSERVSHVEDENALLKQLVTQRAEVDALTVKLDTHHQQAMAGVQEILGELRKKAS